MMDISLDQSIIITKKRRSKHASFAKDEESKLDTTEMNQSMLETTHPASSILLQDGNSSFSQPSRPIISHVQRRFSSIVQRNFGIAPKTFDNVLNKTTTNELDSPTTILDESVSIIEKTPNPLVPIDKRIEAIKGRKTRAASVTSTQSRSSNASILGTSIINGARRQVPISAFKARASVVPKENNNPESENRSSSRASKRADVMQIRKTIMENATLKRIFGNNDMFKKDRLIKFLETSIKRVFRITESRRLSQSKKSTERSRVEAALPDSIKGMYRDSINTSLISNQRAAAEEKEEKKNTITEFVFYREINEIVQFSIRENSVDLFLKAIKILAVMYLHYGKIDEAFHCFSQWRWAAEYLKNYKVKTRAFMHMADICRMLGYYDEALKLLRKALQYSWEYNLLSKETKIYDMMGKLYFLKADIKKSIYYNHRFSIGASEPKDSAVREIYQTFLHENRERGKYGHHDSLESNLLVKVHLPHLPSENFRRFSILSNFGAINLDESMKEKLEKRPVNVKPIAEQIAIIMQDTELFIQTSAKADLTVEIDYENEVNKLDGYDIKELPTPTMKANLNDIDAGKTHLQKLRDIKLKEERITNTIKNAKQEVSFDQEGNKHEVGNLVQQQLAIKKEKRLATSFLQEHRILMAKLARTQYNAFESHKKPPHPRMNVKTDKHQIVMDNAFEMNLQDKDYFQNLKRKVMTQRLENNLPSFVLMTHKKQGAKPHKKDKGLANDGAKKIYYNFYKKIMKKIAPDRVNKFMAKDEQ